MAKESSSMEKETKSMRDNTKKACQMVMGPRSMKMETLYIKVNSRKANSMVKESHTVMMVQRNMRDNGNRTKWKGLEHIGLKKHMTTIRKKLFKLSCSKNMKESGKLENVMGKVLVFSRGETKNIKVNGKTIYRMAKELYLTTRRESTSLT